MRPQMEAMVDFETNEARAGRPSRIIAKMNSLEDPRIIQKLYEASQAGVEIDLIVRGVCRLIPGKENLSENIRVYSVIGRFLEHSRIFTSITPANIFTHLDLPIGCIGIWITEWKQCLKLRNRN